MSCAAIVLALVVGPLAANAAANGGANTAAAPLARVDVVAPPDRAPVKPPEDGGRAGSAAPRATTPRVLVFSRTEGFRHASIPTGIAALLEIGAGLFEVDATEDSALFTKENLASYRAVVFLSTTGDILNPEQERAFEGFIHAGGGYVGIHAAADTEYDWPWYGRLVGALFRGHPPVQQATIRVEDRHHRSTRHLPAEWVRTDEWYAFRTNPRSTTRVLASLDESTYAPGDAAMGDHPIAWYHEFEGGRAWYTALGHTHESFAEPLFRTHLREGIAWAAGLKDGASATPEAPAKPAAPLTPARPANPTEAAPPAPPANPASPVHPTPPASPAHPAPPAHPGTHEEPGAAQPAAMSAPLPSNTHTRAADAAEAPVLASILPVTVAALSLSLMLAGAMALMIIILGAMGQGVRAPLLAWLWPGLGHFSLGYRRRAVLAMCGVLGMFVTGLAVGGVDAVDSKEDGAWFIAQAGNGPLAFGVDALNQSLLKTGQVGTLLDPPRQGGGGPPPAKISSYKGLGAANEFGILFIALGGLMNLVLVMDCSRREAATNPGE